MKLVENNQATIKKIAIGKLTAIGRKNTIQNFGVKFENLFQINEIKIIEKTCIRTIKLFLIGIYHLFYFIICSTALPPHFLSQTLFFLKNWNLSCDFVQLSKKILFIF